MDRDSQFLMRRPEEHLHPPAHPPADEDQHTWSLRRGHRGRIRAALLGILADPSIGARDRIEAAKVLMAMHRDDMAMYYRAGRQERGLREILRVVESRGP